MSGNARLVVCGVAFVACAGGATVALRRPALGVNPALSTPFRAGRFDTLEVAARGEHTTLHRRADGIWVTSPVTYTADAAPAAAAFDAIEKLDPGAIVTTRAQRYAELQVDPAHGIGVRVRQGDRLRLDLVIGKTLDGAGGTLVRVRAPTGGASAGADAVWQVSGDLRALFDKVPAGWRDRSVTTFAAAEAREIAVDARDGQRILLRAGEPAGGTGARPWTVVRSSSEIVELDPIVPDELVSTLSSLKASDFADGIAAATAGLDPPALTVTVTLRGGERDTLLIGGPAGDDDFFVKTNEGPQVFRVKAFNIDRVAQRPIQFRNRLLCPLVDSDIEEIIVRNGADSFSVVRDGRAWRATAPRGLRVDPAKVAPLASVFRGWRAPRIAEGPGDGDPRGRPAVVITGRGPRGSCAVTATPSPRGADSYLARIPASRDLFVLPRWMIDRIALRLDEIRAR